MATSGHESLEHTADVGMRVWAPTLEGLFAEAAVGLIDVMGTTDAVADRMQDVRIDAPDLEALFVDWLSEVLFLFDGRGFVTTSSQARVTTDPWTVEAVLHGVDAARFIAHGPAVKAVTYHRVSIRKSNDGHVARVYLDV